VNLNKLFPRLTIRMKLGIAFAVLALAPLGLVAATAAWITADRLRQSGLATLEHDLEVAQSRIEDALTRAERDVTYLARSILGPLFAERSPRRWDRATHLVAEFLGHDSVLFQVKVVGADGALLTTIRSSGAFRSVDWPAGGTYYAWRASMLGPNERALLPVELRAPGDSQAGYATAAIAIVVPVRDASGRTLGAVVGEARAAGVFAALENSSPNVRGVTGLVDRDGLFLYHSERKRHWSRLLAAPGEANLRADFSGAEAAQILAGSSHTMRASQGRIVSVRPVRLGSSQRPPLALYRAVPSTTLDAPVHQFLRWVGVAGFVLVGVVLALSAVAANQFTSPIYRLRAGVEQLARGGQPGPLRIATNDELEDLAADFSEMAESVSKYRRELEELLAARTRDLRKTHAELSDILANSADAIVGLDPEGRVRVWNRGAEVLFGYSAAEAIGQVADQLLVPAGARADREAAFIRQELEQRGAVVNFQTHRLTKDGRLIPVSVTQTSLVDEDGNALGTSLIIRDTTMQAKLEDQMRRSERLAAVSIMAAGLAHELNNPLAIIANRIECIEREADERCPGCFLHQDLQVVREHVTRLSTVTRDLLRLARDEEDEPGPVVLDDVVQRATALLKRTFVARGIELDVVPGDGRPLIIGSEKGVEILCLNLLLNAADATPPGGTVTVATRMLLARDEVRLEVRDTGPGVPAELRERIFEPFFTTKGAGRGTGLGLAVCRSIVERHGGRIWVEPNPAGGSRFIAAFPTIGRGRG